VQDLQAAAQEAAREIRRLTSERAAVEADAAVAAGRRAGEAVLVRRCFDRAGPDYLKAFVERVTASPGRVCVATDRGGGSVQWVVAHSLGDVLELSRVVSPRMAESGARGGGRGARMQGVGAEAEATESFARAIEEDLLAFLGREGA
jgi:alanyl-tRNA synthetase